MSGSLPEDEWQEKNTKWRLELTEVQKQITAPDRPLLSLLLASGPFVPGSASSTLTPSAQDGKHSAMTSINSRWMIAFLYVLTSCSAWASPWSDSLKPRMDEVITKNFRNRTQVGVVVAVIHQDETLVWNYGEHTLGKGEAPTGDTFFEMGSITKTYTNTLLALEVNRGRVRLEDQVQTLWSELSGTDAGAITLEQLATHTSGLPRMPDNFAPSDPLNPYKDYNEAKMLAFLKSFKQAQPAPHPHVYSNIGMALLGHLLSDKLNRLDYGTYLRNELTGPLGLNDTKTALGSLDLVRAAQGYDGFFDLMPFWDLNVMEPAGALKTTANDLVKYIRFNMHPASTPLGRAAELAQTPRAKTDEDGVMIGLGWFATRLGQHSVITHSGATGGYRAQVLFDRANQLGMVVLSNTDHAPNCIGSVLLDLDCQVPEWKTVDPEFLKKLVGTYYSDSAKLTVKVFIENNLLGLELDGYRMRFYSKSETEYEIPDAQATVQFQPDGEGSAKQFTLLQGGQNVVFVRQSRTGENPTFNPIPRLTTLGLGFQSMR